MSIRYSIRKKVKNFTGHHFGNHCAAKVGKVLAIINFYQLGYWLSCQSCITSLNRFRMKKILAFGFAVLFFIVACKEKQPTTEVSAQQPVKRFGMVTGFN